MSTPSKIIMPLIFAAIILGAVSCLSQFRQEKPLIPTNNSPDSSDSGNLISNEKTKIKIMVPENIDSYKEKMTQFSQTGGEDPLKTENFVTKELEIPYTSDIIKASAQAAAEEIPPASGPAHASIAYFKIENNTAYTLLDIDLDGWAGVSVSLAIIHPLVEKTLMQFPEIKSVVFGYAPGDK